MKSSTLNGLFCTGSAFALTTLAIAIGQGRLTQVFTDPLNEAGSFIALLFFSALLLYRGILFLLESNGGDDEEPLGI